MVQQIISTDGDGQQQYTGLQYPDRMQIRVVVDGVGTQGIPIVWRFPTNLAVPSATFDGGGFVDTGTTGFDGYVQSPKFTANGYSGPFHPTCELRDTPTVIISFLQTNKVRVADVPASIKVEDGNNQSAAYGTAFAKPLKAQVFNQYGTEYNGPPYTVTFTVQSGRGTFPGSVTVATGASDTNGVATSPVLTAGSTAGAFTVTASGTGVTSLTFNETAVNPAIATTVKLYSGNAQKAAPSTAFAAPLRAQVQNAVGGPVAGVVVTFTAPGSGASCTFPGATVNGTSDANGIAASTTPTANATVGTYNVAASGAGIGSVNFSLTNGVLYLPEVCLPMGNAGGGAASTIGQAGSPISAWLNPASAVGNPGSPSVYATNVQQPPNTNRSGGLFFIPSPASWIALADNVLVSKFVIQVWARGLPGGGTLGDILLSFVKNGVIHPNFSLLQWVGWGNGSFAQMTSQFSPPLTGGNAIFGSDLKSGSTGFLMTIRPHAATVPGAGFNVNGATMYCCYQSVDDAAAKTATVPLLFCEA